MPALLPTPDRLAALESRCARLEAELAARPRLGELARAGLLWPAYTVEPDGDGYSGSYPEQDESIELPIVTVAAGVGSSGLVETRRWSTEQTELAISRIGWLPPECQVWVTQHRGRYVILDGPTLLHGIPNWGLISPAQSELISSSPVEFALGRVPVYLYRRYASGSDGRPRYRAAQYAAGGPIAMEWYNTSDEISTGKFLSAARNADNEWIVIVEPCNRIL